jgi:acylphosphatase
VTVYVVGAHGDAKPVQTISGSLTGQNGPIGVAVDADGNIYVVNLNSASYDGSVTVYAAGSTGNVPPAHDINGSLTGVQYPQAIALDPKRNIYITNAYNYSVTVYAAGATGNVNPIRTIIGSKTGLSDPQGIALDAANNIYVANQNNSSITVYRARANGNVASIRTIVGEKTGTPPARPATPRRSGSWSARRRSYSSPPASPFASEDRVGLTRTRARLRRFVASGPASGSAPESGSRSALARLAGLRSELPGAPNGFRRNSAMPRAHLNTRGICS